MAEARPRLYGLPPGCDMAAEVVRGLEQQFPDATPADWARMTIYVNSNRTRHDLIRTFQAGPARLLPRIITVTEPDLFAQVVLPKSQTSALGVHLDLIDILSDLLTKRPDLAPRAALYTLAKSLADLMGEMESEGVVPQALAELDVAGHAAHWQVNLSVIQALQAYLDQGGLGPETVQRLRVQALLAHWSHSPPNDPVLVVGSTGSRGTTRMLMEAVARLPNGFVVLPGFDFDQPDTVWRALSQRQDAEDHPQARFAVLADALGLEPNSVTSWSATPPPSVPRNRLVSLALRPAPVTDQWMIEGQKFQGVEQALGHVTLLEAPTQRLEAEAIAIAMREAHAQGKRAAVIAADRTLARRVSAALARWGLVSDDSAGRPLHLTAPGRLLLQTAELLGTYPDLGQMLALWKHPLTASSPSLRGPHLLQSRELELYLRRKHRGGDPISQIQAWNDQCKDPDEEWAAWATGLLKDFHDVRPAPLAQVLAQHLVLVERVAAGPGTPGSGALWDEDAGRKTKEVLEEFARIATGETSLGLADYRTILHGYLQSLNVRAITPPHPTMQIIGPIEARSVQADLVILAGLNEGTWPGAVAHDPWLNRPMRQQVGLLSPERRIGLAAHDFQQAAAAQEIILSRSQRDDEAETVPSRWLSRLLNLTNGMGTQAQDAVMGATERGTRLIALVEGLNEPPARVPAAPRPSPRPPIKVRPSKLPVTAITMLIRDPYAVYAQRILRLPVLGKLRQDPDAGLRGTLLHQIMEQGIKGEWPLTGEKAHQVWLDATRAMVEEVVPRAGTARAWCLLFEKALPKTLSDEVLRQTLGSPILFEVSGEVSLPVGEFTLTARPDRIDKLNDGTWAIYDYKSGTPPSVKMVQRFEKQLVLEAAILENGGFTGVGKGSVRRLGYIGIGTKPGNFDVPVETSEGSAAEIALASLTNLIARYSQRAQGYTARRAPFKRDMPGDYDHLARYGEWETSDDPKAEDVGE